MALQRMQNEHAIAPVVGWARVFSGVHYPFDNLGAIVHWTLVGLFAC